MTAGRSVPLLLAAVLLAGCALLSPPQGEPQRSLLNALPEPLPHAARPAGAVLVLPMDASAAYDTVRMAYSDRPHQLAYYRDHEWAEPPQQMIRKILIGALQQSGAFRLVETQPQATGDGYTLRSELIALVQDETAAAPVLQLTVHFELGNPAGRAIAARDLTLLEPMAAATPEAGIAAANQAAAKAVAEIVTAVIARTR